MYADHSALQMAGQLLIAFLFVGTGLINSTTKVKQHVDRMAAQGIPRAEIVLWCGFGMQYVGGLSIAFDYRTDIGAPILIVFTILATAIFHRCLLYTSPSPRDLSTSRMPSSA